MNMHTDVQHLQEISIPDIEIDEGWSAGDVSTIEECNDAYAYLMSAVAEIEYELELSSIGKSRFRDEEWPARARRALKYKKAALSIVNQRRGDIEKSRKQEAQRANDRVLLNHIKSKVDHSQFMQWVDESGVGGK